MAKRKEEITAWVVTCTGIYRDDMFPWDYGCPEVAWKTGDGSYEVAVLKTDPSDVRRLFDLEYGDKVAIRKHGKDFYLVDVIDDFLPVGSEATGQVFDTTQGGIQILVEGKENRIRVLYIECSSDLLKQVSPSASIKIEVTSNRPK